MGRSDRRSASGLGLGFGWEGDAGGGEAEVEAMGGSEGGEKGKSGIPRGRGETRGAGWERRIGGSAVASSRQREALDWSPGLGLVAGVAVRGWSGFTSVFLVDRWWTSVACSS